MQLDKGFSLIELLIVVAIIGVLGVVATMSYGQYITRANRTDAKVELLELAQKQERYFSNSQPIGYAENFIELGVLPDGSSPDDSFVIDSGNYLVAMTADSKAFEITATSVSTRQLKDEMCRKFSINHRGKEAAEAADTYKDGGAKADVSERCWSR